MSREEVIETNERLRALRLRLEESYDTAKKALITLMNKYGDSKSQRNVFQRYPMLKLMIKVEINCILLYCAVPLQSSIHSFSHLDRNVVSISYHLCEILVAYCLPFIIGVM